MRRYSPPAEASCTCGAVQVRVHQAIARLFCHCSICQRLNQAPFGDPVFLWRWNLEVENAGALRWKRHRWLPVNVNRGTCARCGTLLVEHVAATPLSIVVGRRFSDPDQLPRSSGHAFYECRVADVDDALPKWSHYAPSQLAMTGWVLRGLWRHEVPSLP